MTVRNTRSRLRQRMKVVCIRSHARSSVLITHLKTATLIDLAVVADAMQGFGNIVDMIWKVLQVPKHTDLFFFANETVHVNTCALDVCTRFMHCTSSLL